jgi:peptidoglycan/xylan/chitin deacetylase (PgdA/CDA1 family)
MFRRFFYNILTIPAYIYEFLYKKRLRVLAYHDIKDSEIFDDQIRFLSSKYNIIGIEAVRNHLYCKKSLPSKSLLITFDDGDISVLEKGLSVLRKYNCEACIFIITELINSRNNFWFKNIRSLEKQKGKSPNEINKIMNRLKNLPNKERLKAIEKYDTGDVQHLSGKDLKFLNSHNISIGNHSHTHPMFNKCEENEILSELYSTKRFFEEEGLEGYDLFAYPNGNYDEKSEKLLKNNNIKMAFLFDHKICKKQINPYRISRIRINSDVRINELRVKSSGLHSFLFHLKRYLK